MQGGRPPLFRCVPLDEVGNASQALTDCTVHSNELKALFQKVMQKHIWVSPVGGIVLICFEQESQRIMGTKD